TLNFWQWTLKSTLQTQANTMWSSPIFKSMKSATSTPRNTTSSHALHTAKENFHILHKNFMTNSSNNPRTSPTCTTQCLALAIGSTKTRIAKAAKYSTTSCVSSVPLG